MAVRGATPDRGPPAPVQWAGQYPPQSQAMYPPPGGAGSGGGMPPYTGGAAYGPGGYPAPMPPQHGGMPTAYPPTSQGTWQPQYGAGSQPPPTASSYGSGIMLGASATPDGRRPSPIVPPEQQSNHDVDQALKYVHDYKSFAMRHEIMKNELHDTRAVGAWTAAVAPGHSAADDLQPCRPWQTHHTEHSRRKRWCLKSTNSGSTSRLRLPTYGA